MNSSVKPLNSIIDRHAKALILGSVPGKESLEKQHLTSSSPANTISIERKTMEWKIIKEYLTRVEIANSSRADYFVSIHINSANNPKATKSKRD
ncbi:N-acetylmuramoyl-L-alanine amidase [Alkaliphilus sp. B6464]|uniref:N-acetylmuramoyl-L-alanine amidase n=1 Tax=Alkaliphilus sp. B6464 TaxID=2731219 RepID=UPI001BA46402|nr:N-acetylmuramoyl-L-alanine amidase [Alkaliphilus sp. B6464]QUH20662.1 N-acetylmuramoyl-L-alanine amidase [Alkaliphilus sp. B6464]